MYRLKKSFSQNQKKNADQRCYTKEWNKEWLVERIK